MFVYQRWYSVYSCFNWRQLYKFHVAVGWGRASEVWGGGVVADEAVDLPWGRPSASSSAGPAALCATPLLAIATTITAPGNERRKLHHFTRPACQTNSHILNWRHVYDVTNYISFLHHSSICSKLKKLQVCITLTEVVLNSLTRLVKCEF